MVDACTLLINNPHISIEEVVEAMPSVEEASSQTEDLTINLQDNIPIDLAIQLTNLIGLCMNERPKGFRPSKIRRRLNRMVKTPALKRLSKIAKEVKDFSPHKMEQLIFYAISLVEGLE